MIALSPATTAAALGLDLNGIMWCDATVNPGLYGCQKISPACTNCYAEEMAARIVRMGGDEPNPTGPATRYAQGLKDGRWTGRVVVDPGQIAPAFAKLPKRPGRIRRVFVTSMSDLFHEDVPFEFLDAVFAEMAARVWQAFQALTKRIRRAAEYALDRARRGLAWPPNVWIGTTVEDQRRADERIPHLLRVPAAVRFLSVEPMLGAVDLDRWIRRRVVRANEALTDRMVEEGWSHLGGDGDHQGLQWVILGAESDGPRPGARETCDEWALDLVDQCDAAGVPVFVKQLAVGGRLCSLPLVRGRVRAEFPEVRHA